MNSKSPSIYEQVLKITHKYLGAGADNFIDKQVENHLNKSPADLSITDLSSLIDWIKVTVSLITEDNTVIDNYTGELQKLVSHAKLRAGH